ncbi:PREDICTED: pentatricopeptide repeat-containing protein At2g01510, mitochondrial-like [Camelina sativa]|uniref:Pentatricopeptide repeat-containing protein At2g01510, mitochondrial-like n=1 Tax=Camelina sativa TaxID=90675 RepID=A0ABM0ZCM7_CAMSA|nr:PREDICTED: pentatricopeptide repeat-containing protein At2g01510, mitochondrial-like [Camelina sativa]
MLAKQTPLTKQMLSELLRASCSKPRQLKKIHAIVLRTGFCEKNSLLTQLLENLVLMGDMCYARHLFDEMHKPRIFLWNTLFKGYVKNQIPSETVLLYKKMRDLGVRPDEFTYPFVVKAISQLGVLPCGSALHAHVVKNGFECLGIFATELVMMYMKFGELSSAGFLFESMQVKDLVAWNAFIAVCVQTGNSAIALEYYHKMCADGVQIDSFTVVSMLSACGQLGSLEVGEEIYDRARKEEIDCNIIVENARLDMHLKCGNTEAARVLFDEMKQRNVVSWSTMIVGYAMNGDSGEALALFTMMRNEGLRPNYVTFLGVLSACSHAGLVNEGKSYFSLMVRSNDKNLEPRKEHYACMVDLLGRSGLLDEAYEFIKKMPVEPDTGIWGALLGACAVHRDMILGQKVADVLVETAPDIGSYHVLLSNIYAAAGKWDCVDKVRSKMRKLGTKKIAAYSSVEFDGKVYFFNRGDKSHPQSKAIYEKLDEILKKIRNMGYVPETGSVFHDVEMEEKESSLSHHSEKLAIAFGLIIGRARHPIRVMKNLRTCDDCHVFSKFVSRLTSTEIIMRDKNRSHHFRNGVCSCREFW